MHEKNMASNSTEFWDQRHDLTPSTEVGGDGGDSYRLVLLVDITDPGVLFECERITDALDEFECLDAVSSDAHHITVKLFDVEAEQSTDDLVDPSPAIRRVDRAVSEVTSVYDPFSIDLTQFNLFPDVVYGEVAGGGQLAGLNREICNQAGVTALERDRDEFIPHLTFGHFTGDDDYDSLVKCIEAGRELQVPTVRVEAVTLVAYEVGGRPPTYNQLETYEL